MLTSVLIVAALLAALGAVGASAPVGVAHRAVYGGSALLTAALAGAGALALLGAGPPESLVLPVGLPWMAANFRLDALAAFFLVLLGLVGALVGVYALGYARHDPAPRRVLPFYPAYFGAMTLVIVADDAFVFLFAWELMSVASWLLVLADDRVAENRRAAFIYLAMAGFGTLALLFCFGLMAGAAGGYGFEAMRATTLGPVAGSLAMALALIGAGSKAGLVPLHVWLPLAHPAAPSHVSALMSGVMTKIALYGLVRIVFDLAGAPQWWWGGALLVVGGATAVVGVLSALLARDLKTLLAYSTVENIGIVVLGLGLALAYRAVGMIEHAALPFVAALFHALNHALFKSLLFCGAGAVLHATRERDAERLGGLIHRMPLTAVYVLAGSAAIAGLPPLNGFVSEWMIYQAIFASPGLPNTLMRIVIPVAGALLALAAALAAACFVRFYGIVFLGRPRSPQAARAQEVGRPMTGAMAAFALLCLALGVLPAAPLLLIDPVAVATIGHGLPTRGVHWLWLAPVTGQASSYAGLVVLLAMALFGWLVVWITHRLGSSRTRRAAPWDCGFPSADPTTQHSAAAIAQPIRRVFGPTLFGAGERVEMPDPGDTAPARLHLRLIDPAWRFIFDPVAQLVGGLATRFNAMQVLTIRLYLCWMFGALVLLLLVVGARP